MSFLFIAFLLSLSSLVDTKIYLKITNCTREMFDFCNEVCDIIVTMSRPLILIVEDDRAFAAQLTSALEGLFRVETCHSEQEFRDCFAVGRYDLMIMDMRLRQGQEGLDLLKEALEQDPLQAAIVMTAYADMNSYADAISAGALTYLDKRDFSPVLIARTVQAIVEQSLLRRRLVSAEERLEASEPNEIIGINPGIKASAEAIRRAAEDGDVPVLIVGEPGSGRQLAARNIHRFSRRRAEGPFIHAACARLQGRSVAAALFGTFHTLKDGRSRDSKGWIDEAKGGVLYADGLNAQDASCVALLVQLIETGNFSRVGGTHVLESDAQVIVSATEVESSIVDDLRAAVRSRGGVEVRIPPLRERRDDVPMLAQYTLQRLFRLGQTQARSFRGAALAALEAQSWPGNVRELIGAIEYAAVRADATGSPEIRAEHIPQLDVDVPAIRGAGITALDYKLHLARAELGLVESAIERFETTKKEDLWKRLHYNDRFAFSRRLRMVLAAYPRLRDEFPRTAALFPVGEDAGADMEEEGLMIKRSTGS
jgi:DNA-binding NtrC family response regulator